MINRHQKKRNDDSRGSHCGIYVWPIIIMIIYIQNLNSNFRNKNHLCVCVCVRRSIDRSFFLWKNNQIIQISWFDHYNYWICYITIGVSNTQIVVFNKTKWKQKKKLAHYDDYDWPGSGGEGEPQVSQKNQHDIYQR